MQENLLKIAYICAPTDLDADYQDWREGRKGNYFGVSYAGQFFELCRRLDAECLAINARQGATFVKQYPKVRIEHRPQFNWGGGFLYHVAEMSWMIMRVVQLIVFRPKYLVMRYQPLYWFLLLPLLLMGVQIVPSVHCALWPPFQPVRRSHKFLTRFNSVVFWPHIKSALVISKEIAAQIKSLSGAKKTAVSTFHPVYARSQFEGISPAPYPKNGQFNILFAGRIEENKGVYDLVEIVKLLIKNGRTNFKLDICGNGSQQANLADVVKKQGLSEYISVNGYCHTDRMSVLYNEAHIVVVPTRTSFIEGINKVCIEAALSGCPVVTSAVCHAVFYLENSVLEVMPNDISAYAQAIEALMADPMLYKEKQEGCLKDAERFYQQENSWLSNAFKILKRHEGHGDEK